MSVKIRFKRVGMTKQPHFRLVAIDHRAARDGKEIEVLGHYDPKSKTNALTANGERIQHWLSKGAQPSDTVRTLLVRTGIVAKGPAKKA